MSSQQSQPNNEAEKEVLVELIESLKENRCLWDTKCDAYANRDLRRAAHGSLLEIYKKFQPNATIDLLKKKIENLKCSFRRELRKVRASETTGAGSSQIYTPRLWFYELMSFLEEKEIIREGLDTLEEDESQMDAVETVSDPGSGAAVVQEQSNQRQNAGPSTIVNPAGTRAPIPRKRKMSALDKKKEAMFDSVQNLLSATEAEWEVIGVLITVSQLRMFGLGVCRAVQDGMLAARRSGLKVWSGSVWV
ncbi:hypothetical protein J6590_081663 [Homalodisca vitripennis]|nr:hypothetical protein J6590_081663 [Homalodisca vitripennis]